jgi:peptide chain release factor 1
MDFAPLIARKRERLLEIEKAISEPNLYDNPKRAQELLRENTRLKQTVATWDAFEKTAREYSENLEMAKGTDELAEMAQAELPELEKRAKQLEREMLVTLLPPDPNEDRDAIMEIRAGTGGDEAAIFAADLYRMYLRYAETAGLTIESIESSPSVLGGYREIIFKVSGENVFRKLRYESGVHRVQRVPATEAQGRIHTSAATVAVLPEAEEVDFELKAEDLRIDVCRSGGPGGQGVNTTDSAVQILHIPTGTIVRCQDGRSQLKNKEKAMVVLRSRLLERKQREEAEKHSAARKSQVGGGDRSEKIRTYNYPQNRVTDHRIEMTLYNLDRFMEGEVQQMFDALAQADLDERLAAASIE